MNVDIIEKWLSNSAGRFGLENEVLETFRSYCKLDPPKDEQHAYRHAWDALYEWDI